MAQRIPYSSLGFYYGKTMVSISIPSKEVLEFNRLCFDLSLKKAREINIKIVKAYTEVTNFEK